MKPANALKIHELIIQEYDKLLAIRLNAVEGEELNLVEIKKIVKNIATKGAPTCASGESAGFGEASADAKIMAASSAAFEIASEHVAGVNDCEEYNAEFRTAYEAALRVEIYRQFLAQGQDYEALKLKFIQQNLGPAKLESVVDYLILNISSNIDSEFSKFKKAEGSATQADKKLINDMEKQLKELLTGFQQNVSNALEPSNTDKIKTIQDAALDYQIDAGRLIRAYQVKAESNSNWAPFLKNMLMLVTGLGTIPAIISMASKAVTGRYAFFDKPVVRETPKDEAAPEDKLLGSNNLS